MRRQTIKNKKVMKKVALIAALFFTANQSVTAHTGDPVNTNYSINADQYSVDLSLDEEAGMLHVTINGIVNHEMIISLINVRGQEAFHVNLQELNKEYSTSINLNDLGKGLYFFKVDSGDEIRLKKIAL